MTTQRAIHVQGLKKSFNDLEVLSGVDFDVARGSIFALLGSIHRSLETRAAADL
jgi:ABC-2 type transport system ATP-binding protein